ncbi:unnamed protein product [Protopolystoma xenopodis]|uniref:Uncharacterized protein n=1 Tax=Protopolystoma xenopodis TaxID=117903 RepID=A0A3S5CQZ7_9PLAT|nr:unnamed protein product [Protopolystoma xenopodis]
MGEGEICGGPWTPFYRCLIAFLPSASRPRPLFEFYQETHDYFNYQSPKFMREEKTGFQPNTGDFDVAECYKSVDSVEDVILTLDSTSCPFQAQPHAATVDCLLASQHTLINPILFHTHTQTQTQAPPFLITLHDTMPFEWFFRFKRHLDWRGLELGTDGKAKKPNRLIADA